MGNIDLKQGHKMALIHRERESDVGWWFSFIFIIATMMMMRDALVQDTIRDKDEILYERRNLFL